MNLFKKTIITFCAITIVSLLTSCTTNTEPTTATITYISNEGKRFENERIVPIGYKIQDIDIIELSYEGYIFKGWLCGTDFIKIGTKVTKDITLTAQWEEIKDTTPPSNVSDVNITDDYSITWKNPLDKDFNGIELLIFENGKLIKTETLSTNTISYTVNVENNISEYSIKIRTYDTSNNYSGYFTYTLQKSPYTEDGLSILTVSLGELPSYRTAFPNPYTPEQLSKFLYVLTGDKAASQSESIIPTINLNDKKTIFTYEEIMKGYANKPLDPIKWDLVLTAYQMKGNEVDFTKPVLIGNVQNVDLSHGNMFVRFKMETYVPHLGQGIDDQATGFFSYKILFSNNKIEQFIIDIKDLTTYTSVLKNRIVINRDEFKIQGTNATVESNQPIEIKGGNYRLEITTIPSLGIHFFENIIINNGNITYISIPENAFY